MHLSHHSHVSEMNHGDVYWMFFFTAVISHMFPKLNIEKEVVDPNLPSQMRGSFCFSSEHVALDISDFTELFNVRRQTDPFLKKVTVDGIMTVALDLELLSTSRACQDQSGFSVADSVAAAQSIYLPFLPSIMIHELLVQVIQAESNSPNHASLQCSLCGVISRTEISRTYTALSLRDVMDSRMVQHVYSHISDAAICLGMLHCQTSCPCCYLTHFPYRWDNCATLFL